jgi:excisionase family DNA binding protein
MEDVMLEGLSQGSDLPPLLSVEQACKLLGVSRSVGYRAAASGDLPTLRWGRRVYVPTARLLELLGLPAEEKAG